MSSHDAISEYLSLWQIRSDLDESPPADIVLNGLVPSAPLTRDQEEILEAKHAFFARGNIVPGRFVPSTTALISHERNMRVHGSARWGVLHATGASRFICPDRPAREQYVPLTRTLALVTRYRDMDVGDETVDGLNSSVREQARCFVFGHPLDIAAFHARVAGGEQPI